MDHLSVSVGPQKKSGAFQRRTVTVVPVNLENDRAVAARESQFPKPRLQEAKIRGGFEIPHHNLHQIIRPSGRVGDEDHEKVNEMETAVALLLGGSSVCAFSMDDCTTRCKKFSFFFSYTME